MTVNYEIGKPRQDRRMRITLILCIGRTKKRMKTDIFATQADLNRKGRIRNDSPIYKKVREMSYRVETEYSALETFLTGENISASEALARMRHSEIPTFFEYAEKWLSRATMKGKKNYVTSLNNFRDFLKKDIPFNMFSHILISDYIYSLSDRPRAQTMYPMHIKRIYTDAEKAYDIKPFSSFHIDIPRPRMTQHRALDVDSIRKVFFWKGKGKMANFARDCCILSFCLCGTNSVDLYYAPPIKGRTLSYDRTKTKDRREDNAHIEIDIPKQINGLVRKYRGTTSAFIFKKAYKDPHTFNVSLNMGLKVIQKDLGLPRLTFYAFRHSWATIARNELRIDKYTVHEALNHQSASTMIDDIYIKKDFRLINEANRKVVEFIFGTHRKDG